MGAPLKNASDAVFGIIAMQVYDVSRIYSVEDRALFLVVAACSHGAGPDPAS
ncbi:MAG: GAF domain/GGDEF domain/EAL domain protein [uncultured Caballeronia sp.]|nr:MAG: GAF domain/GGDEF domain/EAL domain protein [uncultured Caballeronia sp.]